MASRNKSLDAVVIGISFLVLAIIMFKNLHTTKSTKQEEVDSAIARFCKESGYNNNNCFDSVHVKGGTISYYKSKVFMGKTVIVHE